jgi:hypothetical protein
VLEAEVAQEQQPELYLECERGPWEAVHEELEAWLQVQVH